MLLKGLFWTEFLHSFIFSKAFLKKKLVGAFKEKPFSVPLSS